MNIHGDLWLKGIGSASTMNQANCLPVFTQWRFFFLFGNLLANRFNIIYLYDMESTGGKALILQFSIWFWGWSLVGWTRRDKYISGLFKLFSQSRFGSDEMRVYRKPCSSSVPHPPSPSPSHDYHAQNQVYFIGHFKYHISSFGLCKISMGQVKVYTSIWMLNMEPQHIMIGKRQYNQYMANGNRHETSRTDRMPKSTPVGNKFSYIKIS